MIGHGLDARNDKHPCTTLGRMQNVEEISPSSPSFFFLDIPSPPLSLEHLSQTHSFAITISFPATPQQPPLLINTINKIAKMLSTIFSVVAIAAYVAADGPVSQIAYVLCLTCCARSHANNSK